MSSLPLETDETLVRPLPTVYPGVGVEAGGGGEGLAAVLAGEGPVPSVGPAQICKGRVPKNLVLNFRTERGGGGKLKLLNFPPIFKFF